MRRDFPATVPEDPYPQEGLQWIRGDLAPPVTYMYQNGEKVALPWTQEAASSTDGASTDGVSTNPAVTREFSASSDAYIYSSGTSYPPSGGPTRDTTSSGVYVARSYSSMVSNPYTVNVGLLQFDTSALPDTATRQSASLSIYVTARKNVNNRNLRGEWYAWDGTSADYTVDASSGITAFDVPLSSIALATNEIPLANLNQISLTGLTYLRLHITGGAPGSTNYIIFAATRNTGYPEATLALTYT